MLETFASPSRFEIRIFFCWCHADVVHILPGLIQRFLYWINTRVMGTNWITAIQCNFMTLKNNNDVKGPKIPLFHNEIKCNKILTSKIGWCFLSWETWFMINVTCTDCSQQLTESLKYLGKLFIFFHQPCQHGQVIIFVRLLVVPHMTKPGEERRMCNKLFITFVFFVWAS